jgi:hypothetical protein
MLIELIDPELTFDKSFVKECFESLMKGKDAFIKRELAQTFLQLQQNTCFSNRLLSKNS